MITAKGRERETLVLRQALGFFLLCLALPQDPCLYSLGKPQTS
jgi:hypothetical protein